MIKTFQVCLHELGEVGFVSKSIHWVAIVDGLPTVRLGELVLFESGQSGMVSALTVSTVEVLVLSSIPVAVGTRVARTGSALTISVSEALLGKSVNAIGVGEDFFESSETREIDITPQGIVPRRKIGRQLVTGVAMIDLVVPIGYGQRELIMGDRKTGKSYLLSQTILNQARSGTVCVYAAVGKKNTEIARIGDLFVQQGVRNNTIIVGAALEDSAAEIFLAPYTAMTIAEYFRDQGRDVLVVFDDMSTHAKFYRELSLLSRKFPGRDSYPGDIFYVHSKLVERAGNFQIGDKEASITCLPVVETVQGDITGYIQTNLMSMTDGHIYFDSDLFFKGRRPAINPFISVTRVGHQTQSLIAKEAGRQLLQLMGEYEKTQQFLRFGAELGENSRQILALGDKILAFFDQPAYLPLPFSLQLVLLAALLSGMWDGKNISPLVEKYTKDQDYQKKVETAVTSSDSLQKLTEKIRSIANILFSN